MTPGFLSVSLLPLGFVFAFLSCHKGALIFLKLLFLCLEAPYEGTGEGWRVRSSVGGGMERVDSCVRKLVAPAV